MGLDEAHRFIIVFEGNEERPFSGSGDRLHSSPFGAVLMTDCHRALLSEIATLTSKNISQAGIDKTLFQDPSWLLGSSDSPPLVVLLRSLFQQALRYLSLLTDTQLFPSFNPYRTADPSDSTTAFLASSTGLLATVAAATSSTVPQYLSQVVTCFRLAFWIGYRAPLHQPTNDSATILVEGLTASCLFAEVNTYNEKHASTLSLALVQTETVIFVAGRTHELRLFSARIRDSYSCRIHETLLHVPQLHPGRSSPVKEAVLLDASRRQILFSELNDLRVPLHICAALPMNESDSLISQVVDHVLSVPLDWEAGLRCTVNSLQGHDPVHIIGIGPGTKLTCALGRMLAFRRIKAFSRFLPEDQFTCSMTDSRIAIVGMALRMPGAPSPDHLWQVMDSGTSCLTKIPSNRFNAPDYRDRKLSGRVLGVETGNFITEVEDFDNEFFKVSPREAKMMDPQQRLLLHVAHEAMENANYVRHSSFSSDPDHFGVYIGAATSDYVHNVREDIDIHYVSGTLPAFLSGRISHSLSLGGPSAVIDTACSSAGVALHCAVRALQNGDCRMALAGGVNTITSPDLFLGLDKGCFLSRSGQSRPFDSDADGYSRGEGCGLFVLKHLDDAILDNDLVLGVIRGIEVNQSHRNSSITRTHSPTQAFLLRQLLHRTQVQPEDVDVIEAHAAGTNQGDTSELQAIRDVFTDGRPRRGPLYVTSIKASIGHLEAASGAASVAKVLLMLQHNTIPRQIGIQTLNPIAAIVPSDQFSIPTKPTPWLKSDIGRPRCAIINNYGAAGSNVSILLEEHMDQQLHFGSETISNAVFGMSAPSEAVLEAMRSRYLGWLKSLPGEVTMLDICYTSTARRQVHDYRLCFSAGDDRRDIIQHLTTTPIVKVDPCEPKIVFVFAGHGSQYPGMGSVLYDTCPVFRTHIDACDLILTTNGFPTFLPYLLGEPDAVIDEASVVEQTALFSLEIALTVLWKSWGILPSAVYGHSLGEYAALTTAGSLSLKDALLLIAGRARLVQKHCMPRHSGMMSVPLTLDTIVGILQSERRLSDLVVACVNSEDRHTVAGPLSQLEVLKVLIRDTRGVQSKLLPAGFAYHSPAMEPILEEFQRLTEKTIIMKPSFPCASTVTGSAFLPSDAVSSRHLLRHCIDRVRFSEATQSLTTLFDKPGSNIYWIEISPHRTLLPLVRNICTSGRSALFLDSMVRQASPWVTLTSSLSSLYKTRVDVKWRNVFSTFGQPRCTPLPSYPFQSRPFWVQYRDPSLSIDPLPRTPLSEDPPTPSIVTLLQTPTIENGQQTIFLLCGSHISLYSRAHVVASVPICPASIYLGAVLAGLSAINRIRPRSSYVAIQQIEFVKPLLLDGVGREATLTLSPIDQLDYQFFIHSNDRGEQCGSSAVLHSRGKCLVGGNSRFPEHELGLSVQQRILALDPAVNPTVDVFSSKSIYDVIFNRIVVYAKFLRCLDRMVIAKDQQEGFATMQLSPSHDNFGGAHVVSPIYLDAMVHFAGFIVNLQGGPGDLFVCVGIGSLEILPGSFTTEGHPAYRLYTTTSAFTQDSYLSETVVLASDSPVVIARLKNINFKKVQMHAFASQLPASITPPTTQNVHSNLTPPYSPIPSHSAFTPPTAVSPSPAIPFRAILENSLHLPEGLVREDSTLDSLGLDSLTSIEILYTLRKEHHLSLPSEFLQNYSTVGEVEVALRRLSFPTSNSIVASSDCLEELRSSSSVSTATPICFIHDGTGLVSSYRKLSDIGRDIWAIKDPDLNEMGDWDSVEQMASFYAGLLSDRLPEGVILAGWSFGGVVAYEVAKQLQSRGKTSVKGLILLDSPPPLGQVVLSTQLINHILDNAAHRQHLPTTEILQRQFHKHVQLMSRYRGTKLEVPVPCVFIRCEEGCSAPVGLGVHEWFAVRDDPRQTTAGWEPLLRGKLKVINVPGNHFDMFRSFRIESTTEAVANSCKYVEENEIVA